MGIPAVLPGKACIAAQTIDLADAREVVKEVDKEGGGEVVITELLQAYAKNASMFCALDYVYKVLRSSRK